MRWKIHFFLLFRHRYNFSFEFPIIIKIFYHLIFLFFVFWFFPWTFIISYQYTHPHRSSHTNNQSTTTLWLLFTSLLDDFSVVFFVVNLVLLQPSVYSFGTMSCAVYVDRPTNSITRAATFCFWLYIQLNKIQ